MGVGVGEVPGEGGGDDCHNENGVGEGEGRGADRHDAGRMQLKQHIFEPRCL